ncbi:hypothetical protein OH807_14085 [Kitasatospora sp. NBC_01560]|uniref:hypothetical protein n=1 Tax=Kitasatospora sp. NBC_01560 TaxID=2975965 RepID=UPI0038682446
MTEPTAEPRSPGRPGGRVGGGRSPRPGRRRPGSDLLRFAALLLGLPPLFHLVRADVLSFFLLWIAAATLIRSKATAFDRMMISGVTLVGWTCVLGLVASRWPWGLAPLALAELTAVVLVVARAAVGPAPRRPGVAPAARIRALLPTRDHPLLLSAGLACAFIMYPVLRRDATGRLALILSAEDLGRHSALYDTILRLGGLASLHQTEAAGTVQQGLATYPQGSHLTLAVITSFLRGGTGRGESLIQTSLFVLLYTVTTAALAVAVLWAMHRAAGPALRGWRGLALLLPATAFLVVAELPKMYLNGFISEIFALGLLAVLVALAIRPLTRIHEQVVVLAALTVGISFGHYLLLPAAGLTVLGWAVVHLRGWKRHWVFVLATSAVAGVLALFPIYVNLKSAGSADVLTLPGGIGPVGRHVLFPLVAATVVVLLTPAARANRACRAALVSCTGIVLLSFGIMTYQVRTVGSTSYFYEKMLHQLLVIGLVTMAAALLPLFGRRVFAGGRPAVTRTEPRTRTRGPGLGLRSGIAVLAATGCLLYGVISDGQPDAAFASGWEGSPGRVMLRGAQARGDVAKRVAAIHTSRPAHDERIAVSLGGSRAWGEQAADWGSGEDNLWLGVLNRDQGRSWKAWEWALSRRSAQDILDYAATSPDPLRFYLDDAKLIAEVKSLAGKGKHPGLEVCQIRRNAEGKLEVEPVRIG